MSPKDTAFDAFFQNISNSPEFKKAVEKDWKGDSLDLLEHSLLEMQKGVEQANTLMKEFDKEAKSFGAPPAPGASSAPPKTGNAKEENTPESIEVQRFQKVDGKPWGFEAVAGMDDLKDELRDSFIKPLRFKFMVERLKRSSEKGGIQESEGENPGTTSQQELLLKLYAEYEKFKISIPTGMLFYGPPGTGKTFITKKLAEELGCGFVSKNLGEFGSSYLHQTTKNIKDFFAAAKKAAENEPIILFLDEVDSLVSARTERVDANKAEEISQFLQEFNALESAPNLIVIAATNRPDHLDPAILRSGRLDKKVYLGPPDATARRELFRMYIEKAGRPHGELDYDELSRLSDGYVSADIEAICDEVARDASRGLLELVDEAESGALTDEHLDGHEITMKSIRTTIAETPSSLKMVDMSVYESWLEKIK